MGTSRKRCHSVLVMQESLFLPGRCYPTHPKTMWDPSARAVILSNPRKVDGRYAADLFLQLPARGSGSAALGTQPFDLLLSQNGLLRP
jgi:hypothetical protein